MLRADLSARAIRRIGGFVGASLLEQLVARDDLSDATRIHLNRQLAGAAGQNADAEGGAESAAQIVAAAKKRRHAWTTALSRMRPWPAIARS